MSKITAFEVIKKVNSIRQLTCPPEEGKKTFNIDTIVEADNLLLDLQEKLLDDYGSDPQTIELLNQPKITYRSDTTGCTYQMMQRGNSFTIQAVNFDGVVVAETGPIIYLAVWRANINNFFDIITIHINTGKWEAVPIEERRRNFLDGR